MRELRLVLLALAAVTAALLGAGFLMRALYPTTIPTVATVTPAPRPSDAARAQIDAAIADVPDYTRFFDRLHLVFPSDYTTIMDVLASAGRRSGAPDVDLIMTDANAALRRARGQLAPKASGNALSRVFALHLQEMEALGRADPQLCVAFLFGSNGSSPRYLSFAADHRALVADAAIAGLDAMASGRADKVVREAPSDEDFAALERALVAREMERPAIDLLLDGKAPATPIPDETMCRAGQTYLETLATLPPDQRDRLYGLAIDLMPKS